ncbi:MAG TPA: universal stress protein [Ruminiclostridium sp.]|nr:universal stress protein [Ruminiclostridium sp.]
MSDKRLTPEEALNICNKQSRGMLKIFLGYAPGVGKTYAMLSEANRRLKYGKNIVVGYVENHGREETDSQIGDLEVLPRKKIIYNNVEMTELDVDEVLQRQPGTVLIDELAHTNVPGSKNKKRYEDVLEILDHGINVISTLNIQHLESLNDVVFQITGIRVNETLPDWILQQADEVVVVDLTPDALQNRLRRGNVYRADKVPQALKNFFRKGNLNALRELVLRQAAEDVDEDLDAYMKREGIKDNWHTVERLMVCISSSPNAKKLIRRGARIANRYKCEWFVVSVSSTRLFFRRDAEEDKKMLASHTQLAKQLGAETVELTGHSVSETLAEYANEKHITQIVMGQSTRTKVETFFRGSTINKLIKMVRNVEIHLIPIG